MSNDLVAYSRAGDVFHYRWAARRCLGLIYPNTFLKSIVIEGSNEVIKDGEYVIDVTEYYEELENRKKTCYYQLKHTTVQKDNPFTLSDLKKTIQGFAKRFQQHCDQDLDSEFAFYVVTNRSIDSTLKNNIDAIANGQKVENRFLLTIEKYTNLSLQKLYDFCRLLNFQDAEGDYNIQKQELRIEISQILAGSVDSSRLDNIVSLVQEKVLPDSNGEILKENILNIFEITSENDLFPAPTIWEPEEKIINREQYKELIDSVSIVNSPILVHAPGGVGKSVFCKELIKSLDLYSVGIAYDCFGAGQYRNVSKLRHRHRDALVQIINELSVKGLCNPIIPQNTALDSDIMRTFLLRLEEAVKRLKLVSNEANLYIIIDAADNAEMAASEFSQPCFASQLLRETIPEGCKLIMLCRTERIEILKPNYNVKKIELIAFSEFESLMNLRKWYVKASKIDGLEFHRLTNGNPRVQANILSQNLPDISEVFQKLGTTVLSVENQIEQQLENAISKITDTFTNSFQPQIRNICLGLATLPPNIPISILARAADVQVETIKSFIADLGRSLWHTEDSLHFRDEPTESWFRKRFLGDKDDFENYILKLEPLAKNNTYVSEILPNLYLLAEQYSKLIEIALSNEYLPENNPIETRNVRLYRLQFAFRAALKQKKLHDAIKIAMRAGEETAGNLRQIGLLKNNIDLLIALQVKQKIQEIAFQKLLRGNWNGSENVYIASLLSGIKDYQGEARSYLRSAVNWLNIYYNELSKLDENHYDNKVKEEDIIEIAYAYFNIHGVKDCLTFLDRFISKEYVYTILKKIIRRLIDLGELDCINSFLENTTRQPYYTVAIVTELMKIGRIPEAASIKTCLELLNFPKSRINKPEIHYLNNEIILDIVSFLEACLFCKLPQKRILRALNHYISPRATSTVYRTQFFTERDTYLRSIALRMNLEEKTELEFDDLLPKNLTETNTQNDYNVKAEIAEFKEIINSLFPWYFLRIKVLSQNDFNFIEEVENANIQSKKTTNSRYRANDTLSNDIAFVQSTIPILFISGTSEEIQYYYERYIENNDNLTIPNQLNLVKSAFRVPHLFFLKRQLENEAYKRIKSTITDGPEQLADRYIGLARAVMNTARDDASVYFEDAVNIVSKFGDEIVRRWEAVVSLAKQSCLSNDVSESTSYRFIRCGEVVGENVDREKHWDRNEAIGIATRLSPGVGISTLSRWRDRRIGTFEYQLEELLFELLESKKITSSIAWSMSRFFPSQQNTKFLTLCLEKESDVEVKKRILSDAIHINQIEGATSEYWVKLGDLSKAQNIKNELLESILKKIKNKKSNDFENNEPKIITPIILDKVDKELDSIFFYTNFSDSFQFEKCLNAFHSLNRNSHYRSRNEFWKKLIQNLTENNIWQFIEMLLVSKLDQYDFEAFLNEVPISWKTKVSFIKKYPDLIKNLGKKYSKELVNEYSFSYFLKDFNLTINEVAKLKEGIFEGLSEGSDFTNPEIFFGFVNLASEKIDPELALEVLDFSLERFELHIPPDFGDGVWADWLNPHKEININISSLIWSALGSPKSDERWRAAHTIKLLAELDCKNILDLLIEMINKDYVGAFGCSSFPFYSLHSKLYLLISLARISIDKPELLVEYSELFRQIANNEQHILIQNLSAEIAINISKLKKSIYTIDDLKSISEILNRRISTGRLKHKRKNKSKPNFFDSNNPFAYDFEKYWFQPLARVFKIQVTEVMEIAENVIKDNWKLNLDNKYNSDPRVSLWNNSSSSRETWHNKSSYPKTDNYSFYLSYHSLMIAAGVLISKNSKVSKNSKPFELWNSWMESHSSSCRNGKWLADFKDPVPLLRPEWLSKKNDANWRFRIDNADSSKNLFFEENGETWLNVWGAWKEKNNELTESISISSALVSKNTSASLMRALQTCEDAYDYKIPYYKEEGMEIDSDSFQLLGWIREEYESKEIDNFDPFGDNVDYPPYLIGDQMVEKLGLKKDHDRKLWYLPLNNIPSLKCLIWSSCRVNKDEEPNQSGKTLRASLTFLKHLCSSLNCEILIDIKINREINYNYRSRESSYEYSKPKQKIFILNQNGKLRSIEKVIDLR